MKNNRSKELNINQEAIVSSEKIFSFLNSYAALFFLVISQFKPQSVINLADYHPSIIFTGLNMIWIIAQFFSFIVIGSIYMQKFKIHTLNIVFYLSVFYISVVSFLNATPLSRIGSIIISPLSILMLLELAYQYGSLHKLFNTIYIYFGSLIILNYISMLLYPDSFFTDYRGLDVNWIFGNYQQNLNWFIIFIAFSYYVKETIGGYTKYINPLVYLLIVLTTIKVWSATTLSALGIIFGLLIFYHVYPKISFLLNPFYAYIIGIITTILIAVYEIQRYFTFFIEKILHKSVNFTGRMTLWNNTINLIKEKPIFGHGIELSNVTFDKIGKATAHNHYLNLIYNGGIIYLVLTCFLVYLIVRKTKKYRYTNSIVYINISLIGYFVYFLAEAKINLDIFILMLAGAYYLSRVLDDKKMENTLNT